MTRSLPCREKSANVCFGGTSALKNRPDTTCLASAVPTALRALDEPQLPDAVVTCTAHPGALLTCSWGAAVVTSAREPLGCSLTGESPPVAPAGGISEFAALTPCSAPSALPCAHLTLYTRRPPPQREGAQREPCPARRAQRAHHEDRASTASVGRRRSQARRSLLGVRAGCVPRSVGSWVAHSPHPSPGQVGPAVFRPSAHAVRGNACCRALQLATRSNRGPPGASRGSVGVAGISIRVSLASVTSARALRWSRISYSLRPLMFLAERGPESCPGGKDPDMRQPETTLPPAGSFSGSPRRRPGEKATQGSSSRGARRASRGSTKAQRSDPDRGLNKVPPDPLGHLVH